MPKSNTLNRLTTLLTIITLVAVIGLTAAAIVHAQATSNLVLKYNISLYLTDARINQTTSPIYILFDRFASMSKQAAEIYNLVYLQTVPPYYFTRYREFELIIANASTIYYITPTNKTALYHGTINITAIAKTNRTGGLTFRIKIPLSYANLIAYWKLVILVKAWGKWWVAANFTTAFPMPLSMLLRMLTKVGTGKVGIPVINSVTYYNMLKALDTNNIIANVYINGKPLVHATNAKYAVEVTIMKKKLYAPDEPYTSTFMGAEKVAIYYNGKVVFSYNFFTYGAEYFKTWDMYALWLPYIQSFIVAVNGKQDCEYFKINLTMVLPSGAKTVIYESTYNSTLSTLLEPLGYSCVFGPIYYITPLYKGMTVEKIPVAPSGYEPYMPLVVKTQEPFGSLYYILHVYYKTRVAGEYVDTFEVVTIPRGLKNFGVIGLPSYPLKVSPGQLPAIVGAGLYGYVVGKTGTPVIQPFVYLIVPKTEYKLNTKMLETLTGWLPIPSELENMLSFRWYEVTSSGSRIFLSTGPATNVTLVGKKYFNIKLEEGYTAKYTYKGPTFTFSKYYVEVYYGYNPVLVLDIT
ncbi:MAG: hypothetical protein GXO26_06455, partial [Crenarchaeota archaeon]|nr:hypothetical protein [Thermoproteota archaeon]